MMTSGDPIQNTLSHSSATARGSDTFYSGDRTTAFWGGVNDEQARVPGSNRGLDPYRITNPFNAWGSSLPGQGAARGIYPTSAGEQGSPTSTPAGSNASTQPPAGSDKTGLIVVALIVALLLSR